MNRPSGVPLYRQIVEDLRMQMARGELPPGARLPSESELTAAYNTTRTVRKALAILQDEGLTQKPVMV